MATEEPTMTGTTNRSNSRSFPCPLCKEPLDVRQSKKQKPYVVCDACGVQMFVRHPAGIKAFNEFVDLYEADDLQAELDQIVRHYAEE
jgi:transcription elongation factor Elf1